MGRRPTARRRWASHGGDGFTVSPVITRAQKRGHRSGAWMSSAASAAASGSPSVASTLGNRNGAPVSAATSRATPDHRERVRPVRGDLDVEDRVVQTQVAHEVGAERRLRGQQQEPAVIVADAQLLLRAQDAFRDDAADLGRLHLAQARQPGARRARRPRARPPPRWARRRPPSSGGPAAPPARAGCGARPRSRPGRARSPRSRPPPRRRGLPPPGRSAPRRSPRWSGGRPPRAASSSVSTNSWSQRNEIFIARAGRRTAAGSAGRCRRRAGCRRSRT